MNLLNETLTKLSSVVRVKEYRRTSTLGNRDRVRSYLRTVHDAINSMGGPEVAAKQGINMTTMRGIARQADRGTISHNDFNAQITSHLATAKHIVAHVATKQAGYDALAAHVDASLKVAPLRLPPKTVTPKVPAKIANGPSAPVTFKFARNKASVSQHGHGGFGQDIEPTGRYMVSAEGGNFDSKTWDTGTVTFQKPLRMDFGGGYSEDSNWKRRLSAHYNGLTGRKLSAAVSADGYDGIMTSDKHGPSEIVDLTSFKKPLVAKKAPAKKVVPLWTGTWTDVQARYPLYSDFGYAHAVAELAYDGEPLGDHPTKFTEEVIDPHDVRFQRYSADDSRVVRSLAGYARGDKIPPVLLVERAGELFTADGHHRLTVSEMRKSKITAVIAHSTRTAPYKGKVAIGYYAKKASAKKIAAKKVALPKPVAKEGYSVSDKGGKFNRSMMAAKNIKDGGKFRRWNAETDGPLLKQLSDEDKANGGDGFLGPAATWTNVMIAKDLKNPPGGKYLQGQAPNHAEDRATGVTGHYKWQDKRLKAKTSESSHEKWTLMARLQAGFVGIDQKIAKTQKTDPLDATIAFMRLTGIRPGEDKAQNDNYDTVGALNIRREHVKVAGSKVTLTFIPGKNKGRSLTIVHEDNKPLADLIKHWQSGKTQSPLLFPRLDGQPFGGPQLTKRVQELSGDDHMESRKFRTQLATATTLRAKNLWEKDHPAPLTKAAFKKAALEISKEAAQLLGHANASMTYNSYINPMVWDTMIKDETWL